MPYVLDSTLSFVKWPAPVAQRYSRYHLEPEFSDELEDEMYYCRRLADSIGMPARIVQDTIVPLHSVYTLGCNGILTDPRLKSEIETLEPIRHEYFQLDAVDKTGKPLTEKYYFIYVSERIAALDLGNTKTKNGSVDYYNLVLKKEAITGRHLWRDSDIALWSLLFVSDQLHKILMAVSATSLSSQYCEVR